MSPATPRAALWVVRVPADVTGNPVTRSDLLSDTERRTAAAFRVPGKSQRYVLGRELLRSILGMALETEPADVHIELGHNKRPQLTAPLADEARQRFGLPLDFNLSSTPGRLALGLVLGGRIGVDVEAPRPLDDLHEVARTVLAPEELSWMDAQQNPREAFYRLWTLKEAAAKAHGEGLGLPFRDLHLRPDERGGLLANFDVLESDAERWSVLGLDASGPAALAVHWDDGAPGAIDLEPALPPGIDLEAISTETTARL